MAVEDAHPCASPFGRLSGVQIGSPADLSLNSGVVVDGQFVLLTSERIVLAGGQCSERRERNSQRHATRYHWFRFAFFIGMTAIAFVQLIFSIIVCFPSIKGFQEG